LESGSGSAVRPGFYTKKDINVPAPAAGGELRNPGALKILSCPAARERVFQGKPPSRAGHTHLVK
jgi:hypothetical protein